MRDIVRMIGANSYNPNYPLLMRQILCMHSRLPHAVNKAIVELAASEPSFVCGVDLAGPGYAVWNAAGRICRPVPVRPRSRSENNLPFI